MDEAPHVNYVLWENAWECPPVLLAHRTLLNEMLKYGLVCGPSDKTMWRQFISDFLMEILVYGYCVFRLVRSGKPPQIAPGRATTIVNPTSDGTWRPRVIDTAYSALRATKGWKVVVYDAPATDPSGDYKHPTSGLFRALPAVIQYRMLISNMMRRDSYNSAPTVYTTISNNIGANQSTSRPWFNQVHSAMVPGQVTGRVDFRALVQQRSETIESLRRITEQARRNQAVSAGPGKMLADDDAAPDHAEHIVTDGRDAREARHLQQDNEIVHYVTERTSFVVLQLLGVPPQALGQNINSERLASSNRLTEMSIQHFRVNCAVLKDLIVNVFKNNSLDIKFGECVALSTVRGVEQFVKPARLAEMYACALDLNADDFDLNRIQDYQYSLVAARSTGGIEDRKPRTVPTEEEKDDNRKRKADAVD